MQFAGHPQVILATRVEGRVLDHYEVQFVLMTQVEIDVAISLRFLRAGLYLSCACLDKRCSMRIPFEYEATDVDLRTCCGWRHRDMHPDSHPDV